MNPYCRRLKTACCLLALCAMLLTLALPSPTGAQATVPSTPPLPTGAQSAVPPTPPSPQQPVVPDKNSADRFVTIDFNNVDITVFIKFISELTGKNFVVDNRVKGNVTIISPAKISLQEAYKVFESVLEVHGFAAVPAGEVTKIIPAPDARTKNIETKLREEAASPDDKVVTQLILLKYADPEDIKRLFAPLISKNSVILAYPPTNMLIVTDVYSNIQRLIHILKAIDITGIGREISVIPLEYADAAKIEKTLATIFKTPRRPQQKGAPETTLQLVADERTNTLVLLASEDDTLRIKQLIKLLDKEIPRGKENIRVVYLENATAEELVKVLQEIPKKKDAPAQGKPKSPVISEKVKMTADKATNSLIIMAEKDDFAIIEEVIKKLDIPRAMVYIESLIMEVNTSKDFRLGTEWTVGGDTKYSGRSAAYGGGFTGGPLGGDPSTIVSTPLPPGFSLGVLGETISIGTGIGTISFPSIAAVIQAYKTDKDVHIISTPQILTTDNQEAKISVGKNIPFQTRSAAENAAETYSSFEYRDVAKILKITPQISKDRQVRLNISLEVTSLESTTDFRPTTLKRTIDTTVIVKDNNTVVIGGLIDDTTTNTETKVPCLGDVPLMGWLFKSASNANEKTNLYVFLTPRVIKSPAEAEAIYQIKKEQLDKIEEGNIKLYEKNKKEVGTGSAK
ncbi:MAG: type II secretion system secretin GspD [Desulfobacterales bacterium]|nr:type II secretion system secretin GspD [Desulfobacterales bacterium]